MLLSDIMSGENFVERVQAIALESRRKLGIDAPVYQLGVVVPDVVRAAAELEGKGMKPFLLMAGAPQYWKERGSDGAMKSRLGFGYHEGIEIELLEPGTGSDFYRRNLEQKGRPVIQHLGFLVSDVDAWAKKLKDAGYPVYVRGRLGAGPLSINFAYMDTEKEMGLILEFICHRLFGIWIRPPARLQQLLGRIEIKTGKRCIDM
ncbi:MAG TPA: VOC family protein [Spirochaetota bacterium]|nr:VOC family protein [Spirochaetota bacterium]